VICEIMNEDGTMSRLDDLVTFAQFHNLKIGTIRDLIAYRRRHDHLVTRVEQRRFVSHWGGDWTVMSYANKVGGPEIVALVKGTIDPAEPVLVRMHVHSPFADLFAEHDPRSGQLESAMRKIAEAGSGIVVFLRSPALDLTACVIRARDEGREDVSAAKVEVREYGIGAQILNDLGVRRMTLLTNTTHSFVGIDGHGIEIVGVSRLDGL
ncbi:MAG: 3,4-dihydroxy-2-butanone 4-phosphate synthase, partial [Sphingomonas bacterium]|nr:3,4-dihydroxy-2-butanone 4-phosphate synthase [Sphingomonas bacterium]